MGQFVLKNIDMTLDPSSIAQAIRDIEEFADNLQYAMLSVANFLAKKGVSFVRIDLLRVDPKAYYTGELSRSIRYHSVGAVNEGSNEAYVYTDCEYAIHVEYGTGIYSSNGVSKRNGEMWVYKNDRDGKFYTTIGMPPRPFMHNALRALEAAAENEGARLIARYLPKG